MNQRKRHKARENFIITIFKAVKSYSWVFDSGQNYLCNSPWSVTKIIWYSTLSLLLLFFSAHYLFSQENTRNVPFGRSETINVYPSSVSSNNWLYKEQAVSPDLSEEALYQAFRTDNSARLPHSVSDLESYLETQADLEKARQERQKFQEWALSTQASSSPQVTEQSPTSSDETNSTQNSEKQSSNAPNESEPPQNTEQSLGSQVESESPQASEQSESANEETEASENLEASPDSSDSSEEVESTNEVDDNNTESSAPAPPQDSNSPTSPVSLFQPTGFLKYAVIPRATELYPFAISSSTTPLNQTSTPATSDEVNPIAIAATSSTETISEEPDSIAESSTTPATVTATAFTASTTQIQNDNASSSVPEPATDSTSTTTISVTEATEVPAVSTTTTIESSEVETATTTESEDNSEPEAGESEANEVYEIILEDFGTPVLEPGQFIVSSQLRVSFSAKLRSSASGTVETVDVLFGQDDNITNVGTILVDGEASNAINGGYYLFALPLDGSLQELNDAKIILRYQGELERVRDMYVDAAWIEIDTKIVGREDISRRGSASELKHLRKPEVYELVSDTLNFKRTEAPVFNLRYTSQRNPVVRGVRNFLGRDLVSVSKVELTHRTLGPSGIEPKITITNEGLVTVEIEESDRSKLRPGQYTLNITSEEGGETYKDNFDFQWGILAINPDKSEYEVGEEAFLSIGALTPNGHTICKANLNLYVTSPSGIVEKVTVGESGLCNGNNVIDVPDFSAIYSVTETGTYNLYLERLSNSGDMLGFTTDTFEAVADQDLAIKRYGPSRIYPPATYPMQLTVSADGGFDGVLIERVPLDFEIDNTGAEVVIKDGKKELTWDLSIPAGGSRTVSYTFDAPDISPYLFTVGPARLEAESRSNTLTPSSSSSTQNATVQANQTDFVEHREWQIASDAVGNMILFWDDGATIPTGWTCRSCGSGDFYQRFIRGGPTYNSTGGSATHTPTAVGSVLSTALSATEPGTGTISPVGHSHTLTPTIGSASNTPLYRQLRVIEYTDAAGEPATLPTGVIGIYDVDPSLLPSGWTRYSAQDDYYIYGEDTVGATGGSNTHTHSLTGTTGTSVGAGTWARGPAAATGASDVHTHTVSSSTMSMSNEPPYVEVVLAELDSSAAPPEGLIAMWTEDVPADWTNQSSSTDSVFYNRFLKGSPNYSATGGSAAHTHADENGITSSPPVEGGTTGRAGSAGASQLHTHSVSITDFSTTDHLPPYLTVIFGERLGVSAIFIQNSYRWYVNANTQTPTDPWPVGASDLSEQEPITSASTPVKPGEVVRLRMNVLVENATATASTTPKLQYAPTVDSCSAITSWFNVGTNASSTIWRGYDNASVSDHSTLSSTLLASTTVAETYEENGDATNLPNDIPIDGQGEWDFVLEHNDASPGTMYCFRMVRDDESNFSQYNTYPLLLTNRAPVAPTLRKLFNNEKTASTSPWFEFETTDPEGEKVTYQIQIDNDSDFSSPTVEHDSDSNSTLFENQVVLSDKSPFRQGELIRYKTNATLSNNTTYWWRVRASDPEGSEAWGEWSTERSLTVDTTLTASAWYQTTQAQFDTNTLVGVEAVTGGQLQLISGSSTGTSTSEGINFADGDRGTAWDSLAWNDTETAGDLKYRLQYLNVGGNWHYISDSVLSGNEAGFDTSPVSLLDLDTDVYGTLRIKAIFTDSGGSPSLEDWTLSWGYRVDRPTITKLFPSEKVGSLEPVFEFTTTDPQSDDLTYQIAWSETDDFSGTTTVRTSDTDAGFSNIDTGADTDPFNSGDTIQFTIQPADALANNTTYWWRVRAKDTTGDNAYSFWTNPQSFTVATDTEVSTWFQTTKEQFTSNTLSGTIGLDNDTLTVSPTTTEALIVYGQGVETEPRYREWDGAAWGDEGQLGDVGAPIRWSVVRAGVTREEYVAATVGTDADVHVQVFAEGVWGDQLELTTSMGDVTARGFDIAYETLSGDALVVYCDGDADPSYYVWNGVSWTSGGTINLSSTNDCEWIKLASDPVSDEIILLARDSVGTDAASYEAQVWDGATWGNSTTQGGARSSLDEAMAVEYEESGGQALIVTGDGNPVRFEWNSWNGSAWAGVATEGTISDNLKWAKLVPDNGSDAMTLCYIDESANVGAIRWTGAAWTGQIDLDTAANAVTDRAVDCVYETTAGRDAYSLVTYSDTSNSRSRYWDGAAWSTPETSISIITDASTVASARTGDGTILATFFDDVNDRLDFSMWNGTSWSVSETLESNMSVDSSPYGEPFMMAPRNPATEGTAIVSPGIDFTAGMGPYWDEMSWVDNTPSASDILYSVQYYDSSGESWELISDSEIPGNSTGTTTSPIDLSGLNISTYDMIRPYAFLTCDGSSNCPTLEDWTVKWAGGITISGTIDEYDQITDVTSGTVAVAVNGVLQSGKTGSIDGSGNWSIDNVTTFSGDIITIFVTGAAEQNEAVGVARYDGVGDMTGITLFERHVTLGSDNATTTPLTNEDIGSYDLTNTEDVFFDLSSTTLTVCADTGCGDARLYVGESVVYAPSGRLVTHDLENNGTFTAGAFTHEVNGSWDNNGTTTMTGSVVVFAATSSTESIDSTGAVTSSFNTVTFGTTTGNGVWTLSSLFDVNGALTVSRGTLARGSTPITVAGNLTTGANGLWTGIGTTTFDGTGTSNWSDQNAVLQNIGQAVVDGANKIIVLSGNVAAEGVTIGTNDTLDASVSSYDVTVYKNWINNNNFLARSGEVFFAATTSGNQITTAGDAFYDLSFTGADGNWSFTETSVLVNNDFTIATGTVTLPSATSTIAGSFDATGGQFAHNNGVLNFTSSGAETIIFDGSGFVNPVNDLTFNGGGSWTLADTHATATGDVLVKQGSVTFPSGIFAIEGTLQDTGGSFSGNGGTVRFFSSASESLTAGGSSFASLVFDGTGDWSFTDTNVTATDDLTISQGTLTLPTGTFTIGGSYDNNSVVTPGTGTVLFNSTDSGETINLGSSNLYNVTLNGSTGGWTITSDATTTNNFNLATSSDFTLSSGATLAVGGEFTNSVGGASTTWTGSTLSLTSGNYSINQNGEVGDVYETLAIAGGANIAMWNSVATTYSINPAGSLYSQDHNAVDGDLYIFGSYGRSSGSEYWSYATDFDGTDLSGGSERQVDVRLESGATASFTDSTLEVVGDSAASTTIANQGSGTYTVSVTGGTTTAQYYEFSDLGSTGLSLLGGTIVTLLRDGSYEPAVGSGAGLTLSSTTIDANPAKQIFNVRFATTSAISAFNVAQSDGTPASFWWFREGLGNLYGEDFDNDTGDPGSVRFDDSSLIITISGVVYEDNTTTPITGGTCDGTTPVVRVMIEGELSTTTPCSNVDGSYTATGVTVIGDPTVTVFLNDASGGEVASAITRTPTGDITDMDLYSNRVVVRNEDDSALTIDNLAVYDGSDDTDLQFTATTTGNPHTLVVRAGNELRVFASSTFTPGGEVTLNANGEANSYDGTLYLDGDATFNAFSSSTLTIGGRLELETGATFDAASTTALFTATTTGKSITSPSLVTFNDLTFNGDGGGWNLGADISVLSDMTVGTGTVTGTEDITVTNGSLTGNGTLSLGGGTTTIERTNTLGGLTAWTFNDLVLGNGSVVGTTTPIFTSTTTVSGQLVIANAHFLDAGATKWDLAGTGTVFTETGTFLEDTSTIRFSGNGADVLNTQYYNLDINAGAGTPTYTAIGAGLIVDGDLTIGGDAATIFDLTTNDPSLDANGDVRIRSNGTLSASDSNLLTIAGSYDNDGTFTSNNGTTTFDGAGAVTITAGASSFADVEINGTGDFTISEHATATGRFVLSAANSFTLASGDVLAVGEVFDNQVGGAATTWSGSTLSLYGGGDYEINPKTVTDSYDTLAVASDTNIRMWRSAASVYDINNSGSLYSMDHDDQDGELYIFGSYQQSSANDYWDYAHDFDGTALGGSSRAVNVYFATSSSLLVTGGSLHIKGSSGASTTIQSAANDQYDFRIGGNASTSMEYYIFRDMAAPGITFSGTPTIDTLARGEFELAVTGSNSMTVGGSVITNNPAKTFNFNQFNLGAAANGFNVQATGTALSSWRFFGHSGDIDGEDFDVDPDGDPGYLSWDDSTSTISISGRVYSDEGVTVSSACGATPNISLYVNGALEGTVTCDSGTGLYTVSDVNYSPGESVIAYIDGEPENAVTVTVDLVSNVGNFDLYENRVILRHESNNSINISDLEVWDSDDDPGDILFDAELGSPNTLVVSAGSKLIVWDSKEFEPSGNVTVSGGGAGAEDGTLQLQDNAIWTAQGSEDLNLGGSMILNAGATFESANGTTTFTSSTGGRTVDVNGDSFYNLKFTGSGSWSISDTTLTIGGDFDQTAGTLTLPTATTTVSGSFMNNGGTFDANGGVLVLAGAGTHTVAGDGSNFADVRVTGSGSYTMSDTNATATESFLIEAGSLTLPSGTLSVGGDFRNLGGSVTHNTSELILTNATSGLLLASSSDLSSVTISGAGAFTMEDVNITLLDSLTINNGSLTLATGTLSIGGSFLATGGTFDNATGSILFNSSDTGEIINPGVSEFNLVQIAAPTGGYTIAGNATTTSNFTLQSASDFTLQSGSVLYVGGVFLNNVGGSATTWSGSTLVLGGANEYSLNTSSAAGDDYQTLVVKDNSDLRMWNSQATTTNVAASASLYSQDHGGSDGALSIYGDFHISTSTEFWSYTTDFDGTDLSGGSERVVIVSIAQNSTTTLDGGTLQMIGNSGNRTTVSNQGSGTYSFNVSDGTLNAQYYNFRNLNATGLNLTGMPTLTSLDYGDFELAVDTGTLITLSSTTLNANASEIITGNRFATTTPISGKNVTLVGSTVSVWNFVSHTGNLDGEGYDVDGATACGQIRWADSNCQITQQTHYRWRNDDGGLGVPADEWFDVSWDARKRVRIENNDNTTYADAAIELAVVYDADMQADFDDLRFTDESGTTTIPFWIGSTTDSVSAEVWVKLDSLPANDTATVFMYYNNPTALSSSSASTTFLAADDFEDGNISEYSGETTEFSVDGTFAYGGSYGLDATGNEDGRTNGGGIYDLARTVSQGETIQYQLYVDAAELDEVCTMFGIQSSGAPSSNYAVCTDLNGTDRLVLARDVVDSGPSGTELDAANVTYATGWYEVEVKWGIDDSINVTLFDSAKMEVATLTATDSNYTTGGIGFTFWFQHGGWDNYTVRPTLTNEPTVRFGVEQGDGGATWAAAQDTTASDFSVNDIARLIIAVENSGMTITNQQFLLEYAEQGAAPSCEAVSTGSFAAVPVQASCGTSPVCMQTSANFTNGASTVDHLTGTEGDFVSGEAREDPSNITGNLDVAQNEYIELEYSLTPTANVDDPNLCFRVTNNGTDYETYLEVAKMNVRFDPSFGTVWFNGGDTIALLPGTTTRVYATSTVTDLNGFSDLTFGSSTMYTTAATAACTEDNNDCYISTTTTQCSFINCSGNSCTLSCYADIFFHADSTDTDGGLEWFAFLEAEDTQGGVGFATSLGTELMTLRAIDVVESIDYGALTVNSDTGSNNPTTTITNQGNVAVDVEIEGTDLSDGLSSTIPANQQKYATTSFNYSACVFCTNLPTTSPPTLDVELGKPTTDSPPVADDVYWGIAVPIGTNSSVHEGTNIFTPVSE